MRRPSRSHAASRRLEGLPKLLASFGRALVRSALVIGLLGVAPRVRAEPPALAPGDHDLQIEFAGKERTYLLHVPPSTNDESAKQPLPLLLAFHGGGGAAAGYQQYAGLDTVSDREHFVVAYPDGSGRLGRRLLTWNAGECCAYAQEQNVDDVGFARALVATIGKLVQIDRSRVYATGHSNGAMMSYRLAAEAPDLVAAIGAVAGALSVAHFASKTPVPVLHIHSIDDPRAPYAGGLGPRRFGPTVKHHPVELELRRFIVLNGCPAEAEIVAERREQATGFTATHLRYAPCATGADVELIRLTGAGHGWSGGQSQLPTRIAGPDTNVISAAEEVWRFVSRFEREPAVVAPTR